MPRQRETQSRDRSRAQIERNPHITQLGATLLALALLTVGWCTDGGNCVYVLGSHYTPVGVQRSVGEVSAQLLLLGSTRTGRRPRGKGSMQVCLLEAKVTLALALVFLVCNYSNVTGRLRS